MELGGSNRRCGAYDHLVVVVKGLVWELHVRLPDPAG